MIECTQMNYALPKDATTRVHHALAAAHARALSRLRAHPRTPRGTAARVAVDQADVVHSRKRVDLTLTPILMTMTNCLWNPQRASEGHV